MPLTGMSQHARDLKQSSRLQTLKASGKVRVLFLCFPMPMQAWRQFCWTRSTACTRSLPSSPLLSSTIACFTLASRLRTGPLPKVSSRQSSQFLFSLQCLLVLRPSQHLWTSRSDISHARFLDRCSTPALMPRIGPLPKIGLQWHGIISESSNLFCIHY